MSRTENSMKNLVTGLFGQFLIIIFQFLCRTVFVRYLSSEYLGINGLFTNILSILSLSELGIGTAMLYSLYKPVHEKDEDQIIRLLNLYRLYYRCIALLTLSIGLMFLPFLDSIIDNKTNIMNISYIYILYLVNSVVSYLMVYKKSIIEANQKMYICNVYQKSLTIIQNILQMIFLIITRNFIAYLLIQIGFNVLTNLFVSRKANKLYPFILNNRYIYPDKETKKKILHNAISISFIKIGGIIGSSTDNLILTKFVGLAATGLYSNYSLIINNISIFINQALLSFTASIGNLGVSQDNDKLLEIFNIIYFFGYWIYSIIVIVSLYTINPFIDFWLGEKYCLSNTTVFLILMIFYFSGMRRVPGIFRDALGIFRPDRYKALVEGVLNLVFSIYLVNLYGIDGVFLGTLISIFCVAWFDIYILYKYGFKSNIRSFFVNFAQYTFIFIIVWGIIYIFDRFVQLYIFHKMMAIFIISNLLFMFIFYRNENFKYLYGVIHSKISRMLHRF